MILPPWVCPCRPSGEFSIDRMVGRSDICMAGVLHVLFATSFGLVLFLQLLLASISPVPVSLPCPPALVVLCSVSWAFAANLLLADFWSPLGPAPVRATLVSPPHAATWSSPFPHLPTKHGLSHKPSNVAPRGWLIAELPPGSNFCLLLLPDRVHRRLSHTPVTSRG